LIRGALGLGTECEAQLNAAQKVLSPASWAVLTSELREKVHWFQMRPPNQRAVAAAVHRVLDEIEHLDVLYDDPILTKDTQQR
jgi:hypothetical protein